MEPLSGHYSLAGQKLGFPLGSEAIVQRRRSLASLFTPVPSHSPATKGSLCDPLHLHSSGGVVYRASLSPQARINNPASFWTGSNSIHSYRKWGIHFGYNSVSLNEGFVSHQVLFNFHPDAFAMSFWVPANNANNQLSGDDRD